MTQGVWLALFWKIFVVFVKPVTCIMLFFTNIFYLSFKYYWLYVLVKSRTRFRVNTLYLSECQGTPCSKQAQNLKFKWLCNWTRTQNHLDPKKTLNYLAKLAEWLSCVLSTYLYGVFECMFFSCHVRVLEWIHTL